MATGALSEEAMLAGLRDIRLPADAPGGLPAEALVALGLGLLLAALIGLALRTVTRARPLSAGSDDMAPLLALPEEEQRLALLHLLKSSAPARYAALTQALYQPGGLPDTAALRAEVLRDD